MKLKFLLPLLFSGFFGFSQSADLKLPNLKNEFKVTLGKNESDDITVHIIDSENTMRPIEYTSKRTESLSAFTETLYANIEETDNYYFKLNKTKVAVKLTQDQLKSQNIHDLAATEITKLKKEDFITLVESKTIYKADNKTFTAYRNASTAAVPAFLFPADVSKLQFKKSAEKFDLYDDQTITAITDITTDDGFWEKFYRIYCNTSKLQFIKDVLLTDSEVKEIANTSLKTKNNTARLEEIYRLAADKKSEYEFIGNYEILDGSNKPYDYTVSIKNDATRRYSLLKFCSINYDCEITSEISFDMERSKFETKINDFVKKFNSSFKMENPELAVLHEKIKSFNEKKIVEERTQEYNKKISSMAEQLDNMATKFSGVLSINKEIPVYEFISRCQRKKLEKGILTKNEIVDLTPSEYDESWLYKEVKDVKFIVKDTTNAITFFNNKVKSINIVGFIKDNPQKIFSVSNINYSLPLRSLNNSTHYIPISPRDSNAKGYYICLNDLLDYGKSENVLSFSVKNKDYTIRPGKNIKIEQRKLMDFFTAIIFSDVLGINSENPNSLLLAEGRIKVPLWLYNFGMVSYLNFLNADFNVSLYNGLDEKSRYIKPVNDGQSEAVSQYIINNFDYIKYNNFNAGISLNFVNIEMKGLNSELSFAGGFRYYRTGLRYTYVSTGNADIIKSSQLNSLTYEISTNFEIRPQSNFGADINVGLNWLNARGSTDNIPIVFNPLNNNDEKTMLRLQGNFYVKLDPQTSNDGIYVRMGGFYHLGSKDFYPQILVGYATNLSSFVNGFKK